MRLSLELGIPVGRLQNEITSMEFSLYMAYYNLNPFGPERLDLGVGHICDTIAKVHGNRRSKPADYIPEYGRREELKVQKVASKTNQQILNSFQQMAGAGVGKMIF